MIKVAVIGCGDIAIGYNLEELISGRKPKRILTHAAALKSVDEYELVACIDPDSDKTKNVQSVFPDCQAFASLSDFYSARISVDLLVLAGPAEVRGEVFSSLDRVKPGLIVSEKPFAATVAKGRDQLEQAESQNIAVCINYMRHWDSALQKLSADIKAGVFGQFQGGQGGFVKGIRHNGSHLMVLIGDLLGIPELLDLNVVPTAGIRLSVRGGQINLLQLDHAFYNFFELVLFFEHAVIHLEDGARRIRIRRPKAHDWYPDFAYPEDESLLESHQADSLETMYREIRQLFELEGEAQNAAVAGMNRRAAVFLDCEQLCDRIEAGWNGMK